MKLNIQIYSLLFSFLFGIIFNFILDIFNRLVNNCRLWLRIILSILFTIIISIVYFCCLLYINNGFLHLYFLLSIAVGYIFVYGFKLFWFTHKKENSKM